LQWWIGAVLHSYLRLAQLARRSGCRVIIEWHEVDTGEARIPGVARSVTTAMKVLLRNVDGHVMHSQYDLDLLRRTYDLPDELVAIAAHGPYDYHGRDAHAHAAPAIGQDAAAKEFVFLYFGVVRPYKGVEDLVAAFDLLPRMSATAAGSSWSAKNGNGGRPRSRRSPPV